MIPNSPVDPELLSWGWPWHGRIDSSVAGVAAVTLPSGNKIACPSFGGCWTYLWDINMPEVENEQGSDEQWWNVAILRGHGTLPSTPTDSDPMFAYGGMSCGAGPLLLNGQVGRLLIGFRIVNEQMRFEIETYLNDDGTPKLHKQNIDLAFASIGTAYQYENGLFYTITASVVDRTPDGKKSLIRLSRNVTPSTFTSTEVIAIVELEFGGTFIEPIISLNVIDSGASCRGTCTILQRATDAGLGQVTMGRATGYPGTHYWERLIRATCNAWYDGGTPKVVTYEVRDVLTSTEEIAGEYTPPTQDFYGTGYGKLDQSLSTTFKLRFGDVEVVGELLATRGLTVSVEVISGGGNSAISNEALKLTLNGETIRDLTWESQSSNNAQRVDFGLWDLTLDEFRPAAYQVLWLPLQGGFQGESSVILHELLSNYVVDIGVRFPAAGGVSGSTKYFACLYRNGTDASNITRPSDVQPGFLIASINPVTGQLIRRENSPEYSWV